MIFHNFFEEYRPRRPLRKMQRQGLNKTQNDIKDTIEFFL